jgi:hypothetical protein
MTSSPLSTQPSHGPTLQPYAHVEPLDSQYCQVGENANFAIIHTALAMVLSFSLIHWNFYIASVTSCVICYTVHQCPGTKCRVKKVIVHITGLQ